MKEKFRDLKFHKKSLELIKQANSILQEYMIKEILVTLRQLYYQMVGKEMILNTKAVYAMIGRLMAEARYCGLVDWTAIEDRTRIPHKHVEFEDVSDLICCAKSSYRLDRWQGQKYYIELWTEKDALSSILQPIADKWHIHFCVNRGFASVTALYNASKRILSADEKEAVILYLGDFDPSGLGMIKDINTRLTEFNVEFEVVPIALTMQQVRQHKLPPNFAKEKDPRWAWYKKKFGSKCWEVDALKPDVLVDLVDSTISKFVDSEKRDAIIHLEQKQMKRLEALAEKL